MSAEVPEFAPYFRSRPVDPAVDPSLMRSIFALRFQVYCVECKYLPMGEYPEAGESDEYDAASSHFFARNLRDELVGYVRLVAADSRGSFPFQRHCLGLYPDITLPDPAESGEVSRLMVHHDYRRRRGDTLAGVTVGVESVAGFDRRTGSPQILLSMYRQLYQFSLENGVRYWYTAMESGLARALSFFGFRFRQIGPEADYFGAVAPYLGDLRALEDSVGTSSPELMDWLRRKELKESITDRVD
jgi:N-acyl amino acid synthase of PEP-CTERM/exosortase system